MNAINTLIQKLHAKEIAAYSLFKPSEAFLLPGDVVDVNGSEEMVIHAELLGGEIKYATDATDGSTWYTAADMKLIRRASK